VKNPAPGPVRVRGYRVLRRRKARPMEQYLGDPSLPFHLWLRFLVGRRVAESHRRHLSRPGRDVGREISIDRGAITGVGSGALAARLLGKPTNPVRSVVRAERKLQLLEALNGTDPIDRGPWSCATTSR
jgi:RNA polymerase sigma-70 factor (ECF subfamily)